MSIIKVVLLSHMSGRNIWINFEAPQQYTHHINPWKKCSNLMQILKYLAEPFLRPLRSKGIQCWILRLRPRNFTIISESLAANLEKVRQTSDLNDKLFQSSDLFDFDIFLFALITRVSLLGTDRCLMVNKKNVLTKGTQSLFCLIQMRHLFCCYFLIRCKVHRQCRHIYKLVWCIVWKHWMHYYLQCRSFN
jgi:hypothetical protein